MGINILYKKYAIYFTQCCISRVKKFYITILYYMHLLHIIFILILYYILFYIILLFCYIYTHMHFYLDFIYFHMYAYVRELASFLLRHI